MHSWFKPLNNEHTAIPYKLTQTMIPFEPAQHLNSVNLELAIFLNIPRSVRHTYSLYSLYNLFIPLSHHSLPQPVREAESAAIHVQRTLCYIGEKSFYRGSSVNNVCVPLWTLQICSHWHSRHPLIFTPIIFALYGKEFMNSIVLVWACIL